MQVRPDSSVAQRSAASGRLVMVMPKEDPAERLVDVAYLRSARRGFGLGSGCVPCQCWLQGVLAGTHARTERT